MSMNVRRRVHVGYQYHPYIDILLVLLIIFMVITPVRQMDWM